MHHGVTAKPRQVASADLRSRVSRFEPLNAGSGQAIGVCTVLAREAPEADMTASAPSCRAPSTPRTHVVAETAKLTLSTPAATTHSIWLIAVPWARRCISATTAPIASADGSSQPISELLVAPTIVAVASETGLMSVSENNHQPTEMAPRITATMYIITSWAYPLNTEASGSRQLPSTSSE